MHPNLDTQRIKLKRWRALKAIEAASTIGVTEELIAIVLDDVRLPSSPTEIREILRYLSDSGYIALNAPKYGTWHARLLPKGIQFIEDPNIEDIGIKRPEPM